MIALKNILVATDFSEPSAAALRYGTDLARNFHATLHILNVVDSLAERIALSPMSVTPDIGHLQEELEVEARRALDNLLTTDERKEVDAQLVVRTSSRPADVIVGYARDVKADLIVIGTHGRTGMAHFFMGSVAQQVVRSSPCPVLTVRHPEREFVHPDALQTVTANAVR